MTWPPRRPSTTTTSPLGLTPVLATTPCPSPPRGSQECCLMKAQRERARSCPLHPAHSSWAEKSFSLLGLRKGLSCLPPLSGKKWIHHKVLSGMSCPPPQIPGFAICAASGLWEGTGLALPFHLTQSSHSRDYLRLSKGKLRSRRPPILPEH